MCLQYMKPVMEVYKHYNFKRTHSEVSCHSYSRKHQEIDTDTQKGIVVRSHFKITLYTRM